MAYAAKHDGYHVSGDFPPPFGHGRSAQPLAKAGGETSQNMGRLCAKLTNLSAEKKQAAHWTDPGAAPHFSA